MGSRIRLSVVIPTYRAAPHLPKLFKVLEQSFSSFPSYEILFIEDNSPDETWEKLCLLCKNYSHLPIKILGLPKNLGQQMATLLGLFHAQGEYVATLDDDLQVDPKSILLLYEHAQKTKAEIVYGIPKTSHHPAISRLGSRCLRYLLPFEYASSCRLLMGSLAASLFDLSSSYANIEDLVYRLTSRVSSFPIDHKARDLSPSSYSLIDRVALGIRILTQIVLPHYIPFFRFSTRRLRDFLAWEKFEFISHQT
ncbi:MAG: glycosyltransferase [Cytophagales bacterium]|nr:glycosyltransferase [Cytophagales bacterium]